MAVEDWQQPYVERADEMASELRTLVERLDDMIVDHLRAAVDEGISSRPPLDKKLQSARRALEKASDTLRH